MNAILFDLDGTLTDPREGITRSLAHAMERMGLAPPPPESLTFAIGPPLRASLAQLLGTATSASSGTSPRCTAASSTARARTSATCWPTCCRTMASPRRTA